MLKVFRYNNLKQQSFLTRPKIHKTRNPRRPVVSSVNWHTKTISKYVDFHLQPIVTNIPSYVKDTTDFFQKLDSVKNVPNDCLLVTLDVKSLYTNIPNDEGIKPAREAYDNHPNKAVAAKVIPTFFSLIKILGTIGASAYANIFMLQFGKYYLYPYIKKKSILYERYINNIFMTWTGTKQELFFKKVKQQT